MNTIPGITVLSRRGLIPSVILLTVLAAIATVESQEAEQPRISTLEQVEPDEPMTLTYPPVLDKWGFQKGGPTLLRIYTGGRTRFDDPQGLAVTVLDSWDDPDDDKDDDQVTVYGVNSGRGEIIYNTSMFSLGIYGSRGRGVGQFREPHGIDADPAGDLVVADTGNDRVAVLFNNGQVLSHRVYLEAVAAGDTLRGPYDVALTPDSAVWVTDAGNSRLVHFGLDGAVRKVVELDSIMGHPGAIAVSHPDQRWSYYRPHHIFVASREGDLLVQLDGEGAEMARVTAGDIGLESMELGYLTTDFYGNLWATDRKNHTVHKFDREMNYLTSFGSRGKRAFQFENPRGIDMWRRFGQVFIAEEQGAQYYWVGADAYDVTAVQEGGKLRLSYFLSEHSYLTVRVRYAGGGLQELYRRRIRRVGERNEELDLNQTRPLAWVEVVVEPTYSSYTHKEKVFYLRFPGRGRD